MIFYRRADGPSSEVGKTDFSLLRGSKQTCGHTWGGAAVIASQVGKNAHAGAWLHPALCRVGIHSSDLCSSAAEAAGDGSDSISSGSLEQQAHSDALPCHRIRVSLFKVHHPFGRIGRVVKHATLSNSSRPRAWAQAHPLTCEGWKARASNRCKSAAWSPTSIFVYVTESFPAGRISECPHS